jgi:group I intron endonuclease
MTTTTSNAAYHRQTNPKDQGFYGLIYITVNTVNNKIYIGQTIKLNADYYIGSGIYITRAINKYGKENFNSYLLQYAKDQKELDQLERMYIAEYNSTNPKIGYNIELGGNGTGKISEVTKQKISEARKGKYTGEKNPMYGKTLSEATRRKLSEAHKGKTLSEATKRKMSKAKSGENHPMYGKTFSDDHKRKLSEASTKDKSHITDKILFQYLQGCINWNKEIPPSWGVSHTALQKMIKNRYSTTSAKQVQIILADRLGYKVLNHINFIEYCKHHKSDFFQMSSKVFGISGEQLQRWAARAYSKATKQTINGWCKQAKELEAARQRSIKKRANK